MKKEYKILIAVSIVGLFFSTSSLDASPISKTDIINKEMDCISSRLKNGAAVQWADICYSQEETKSKSRNASIDIALEKESARAMKQEHDAAMDTWRRQSATAPKEKYLSTASSASSNQYKTLNSDPASQRYSDKYLQPKKHQWKIGPEFYYARYKEPGLMEQNGILVGASGEYTYQPQPGEFLYFNPIGYYKVQAQGASGKFNYHSFDTGESKGTRDITFDVRGLLGKEQDVQGVTVGGYSGVGFRYLLDPGEGTVTTTGHFGYDRISNYIYIPLGLDLKTTFNERWAGAFNFEYDIFVFGQQRSYLGYVAGYDDITNDQKHGFGVRTSMEIIRTMENISLSFGPFVRYWHIDDSDVTTDSASRSWIEPENKTTEAGIKAGISW